VPCTRFCTACPYANTATRALRAPTYLYGIPATVSSLRWLPPLRCWHPNCLPRHLPALAAVPIPPHFALRVHGTPYLPTFTCYFTTYHTLPDSPHTCHATTTTVRRSARTYRLLLDDALAPSGSASRPPVKATSPHHVRLPLSAIHCLIPQAGNRRHFACLPDDHAPAPAPFAIAFPYTTPHTARARSRGAAHWPCRMP